ncbi:trigger factor [Actinomyces sp. zg-332]|uniref:trigger factor n=1 Tax=Actinomyces sp. zg-332 TaxID=2708340 RepID=UPI001421285B|nr:trigger factor [Actinomyces sp. zg-332]QPK93710.1 trigger factor [Actinomyces sp. zg-332]
MKTTVERLEPTKVKLNVEVPVSEIQKEIDVAYKEIAKQINIPGFRRGKIPPRVVDSRVGFSAVVEQATRLAMPHLYDTAIAEANVVPMGQPDVEVTQAPGAEGKGRDADLVFVATVEVRPEIELPNLDGLEVTVDTISVSDEEIDDELLALRKRFGTLKGVERPVEEGDFVSIDLTATIKGEQVDSVAGYSYEVGSKSMLEGLDEALLGLEVGKKKKFKSELVGGAHAGKKADINIVVKAVKEQELPEVDEEFVQLASEHDTVEELRSELSSKIAERKETERALQARDKVFELVKEKIEKFPVPTDIVSAELKARVPQNMKKAEKEKVREEIEQTLREQILLDVLAEEEKIEVSQRELLEYMFQMAQAYGIDPSQILQSSSSEQMRMMVADITRNKSLVSVLRKTTVKDTDGNVVDLSEFTKDAAEDEETAEETE